METRVKCPKCGNEFNVGIDDKNILKECKIFLRQALQNGDFDSKGEEERQKIIDLITRMENL